MENGKCRMNVQIVDNNSKPRWMNVIMLTYKKGLKKAILVTKEEGLLWPENSYTEGLRIMNSYTKGLRTIDKEMTL